MEYAHILHPTLHAIRSSKDSVAEMIKKEWHFVQPILLRNEDMRIRYFQLINSFKAELAFEARETAAARGVGVVGASNMIISKLIVSRATKRKVTGDDNPNKTRKGK